MLNYKMLIAYDGTRYDGWQRQDNTGDTIQGKLEQVLSAYYGQPVEVSGSGRTDAGVHALEQVVNFHEPAEGKGEGKNRAGELQEYLNHYLPQDIRVNRVEKADPRFHARLSAKSKIYEYRIDCGQVARVFERKYLTRIEEPLDIEAMKAGARLAIGTHDFKSFCSNKRLKKSAVRTLHSIDIDKNDGILTIRYHGDGFLYNMVRILTGTLIEMGRGKREPEEMTAILEAADRAAAGYTAPPQGLFLVKVFYLGSK